MAEMNLMKDGLGPASIERMANSIARVLPDFDVAGFVAEACEGLDTLELKARVHHLMGVLHRFYRLPFPSLATLLADLPQVWDAGDPDDPIRGFAAWPVIDYVSAYGLDYPELALPLLARLTPLFSAEFAIRPFIERYPEQSMATLQDWTQNADEHVRRLASEGCRPRLPWGAQLKAFRENPAPILPVLEALKADSSLYVRRSVANNLNDISKDHPGITLDLCRQWQRLENAHTDWLIKHGLRGLIKQGDPEVFPLLGFSAEPQVQVRKLTLDSRCVVLGDNLEFALELHTPERDEHVVVDYAIHFVKASGRTQPKVFKLKDVRIAAGQTLTIKKQHALKAMTTRRYYPGAHVLALHINGREVARQSFDFVLSRR